MPWWENMPTNNQEIHYDFSGTSRDGKLEAQAVPEANVWQNQQGTNGEVRFAWGDDGHSIVPAPHLPTYTWMSKAPRKAMLTALKELSAHKLRRDASVSKSGVRGSMSSSKKQKLDSMPPFPIPLPPPDGGHAKAPANAEHERRAAGQMQLDKGSEAAQRRFNKYLARSTDRLSTQLDDFFDSLGTSDTSMQSATASRRGSGGRVKTRAKGRGQLFTKFGPASFSNMRRELRQLRKGLKLGEAGVEGNRRDERAGARGRGGGLEAGWRDRVLSARQARWLRREHARSLAPIP